MLFLGTTICVSGLNSCTASKSFTPDLELQVSPKGHAGCPFVDVMQAANRQVHHNPSSSPSVPCLGRTVSFLSLVPPSTPAPDHLMDDIPWCVSPGCLLGCHFPGTGWLGHHQQALREEPSLVPFPPGSPLLSPPSTANRPVPVSAPHVTRPPLPVAEAPWAPVGLTLYCLQDPHWPCTGEVWRGHAGRRLVPLLWRPYHLVLTPKITEQPDPNLLHIKN